MRHHHGRRDGASPLWKPEYQRSAPSGTQSSQQDLSASSPWPSSPTPPCSPASSSTRSVADWGSSSGLMSGGRSAPSSDELNLALTRRRLKSALRRRFKLLPQSCTLLFRRKRVRRVFAHLQNYGLSNLWGLALDLETRRWRFYHHLRQAVTATLAAALFVGLVVVLAAQARSEAATTSIQDDDHPVPVNTSPAPR